MRKLYKTMRLTSRIAASSLLILLFVCTASAYTIVMRGGKRIEIPEKFQVTATTLTYEAGQEIQITLQLAAIDIPATERANNETAGSLLRRIGEPRTNLDNQPQIATSTARRTITNRDLESSMVGKWVRALLDGNQSLPNIRPGQAAYGTVSALRRVMKRGPSQSSRSYPSTNC